jgi:hypothetical protein
VEGKLFLFASQDDINWRALRSYGECDEDRSSEAAMSGGGRVAPRLACK